MWSPHLVRFWCDYYYSLRDYELNPFEHVYFSKGDIGVSGSQFKFANYIETCDLNWEFDKALKRLGKGAKIFKSVYLDGGKSTEESEVVYNKFCKLLMEGNNEE